MSANGGGTFAAILLSIPLTAVALMSVFGIPQLTAIMGTKGDAEETDLDREWGDSRRGRRHAQGDEDGWGDAEPWNEDESAEPFNEFDDELKSEEGGRPSRLGSRGRSQLGRTLRSRASAENEVAVRSNFDAEAEEKLAGSPTEGFGPPGRHENPFETKTADRGAALGNESRASSSNDFARAVRRLKTLGAEHWHVEQGLDSGSFLFVCLIDTAATSGAVHRFEAENRDVIVAVDDVIQQIVEWRRESPVTQASASSSGP
jgi:hypothetical protein